MEFAIEQLVDRFRGDRSVEPVVRDPNNGAEVREIQVVRPKKDRERAPTCEIISSSCQRCYREERESEFMCIPMNSHEIIINIHPQSKMAAI